MVSNIKHLMTVAELEALPYDETKRYELIEGELFVSCAPGLPHQLVLHNLQMRLGTYLEQNPVGIIVFLSVTHGGTASLATIGSSPRLIW